LIDGLEIVKNEDGNPTRGIEVKCPVETLIIRDAFLNNFDEQSFITMFEKGEIAHLSIDGVCINDKNKLIDDAAEKVKSLHTRVI